MQSLPPASPSPARDTRWRRTRRRLDASLAAGSLVLLLIVVVAWPASHFGTALLEGSLGEGGSFVLAQSAGEVLLGTPLSHPAGSFYLSPTIAPKNYGLGSIVWLFVLGDRDSRDLGWGGFGMIIQTDTTPPERPARVFVAPHWALLIATAYLPASWAIRWALARHRRRRPGVCHQCGYDLRRRRKRAPSAGRVLAP